MVRSIVLSFFFPFLGVVNLYFWENPCKTLEQLQPRFFGSSYLELVGDRLYRERLGVFLLSSFIFDIFCLPSPEGVGVVFLVRQEGRRFREGGVSFAMGTGYRIVFFDIYRTFIEVLGYRIVFIRYHRYIYRTFIEVLGNIVSFFSIHVSNFDRSVDVSIISYRMRVAPPIPGHPRIFCVDAARLVSTFKSTMYRNRILQSIPGIDVSFRLSVGIVSGISASGCWHIYDHLGSTLGRVKKYLKIYILCFLSYRVAEKRDSVSKSKVQCVCVISSHLFWAPDV